MKIKIIILSYSVLFTLSAKSQIVKQTVSDEIPKSASITELIISNTGNEKEFFLIKTSGATIFNQVTEAFIYDYETFSEKKKIKFPDLKNYSRIELNNHPHRFLFYPKLNSVSKMQENVAFFLLRQ